MISAGSRTGPRTCFWRLGGVQGGPWESGSAPWGPFVRVPGSHKVGHDVIFDGNPWLILTIPFLEFFEFGWAPGWSQKRIWQPKRRPREA